MIFYDLPNLFVFLTKLHGITKVKLRELEESKHEKIFKAETKMFLIQIK